MEKEARKIPPLFETEWKKKENLQVKWKTKLKIQRLFVKIQLIMSRKDCIKRHLMSVNGTLGKRRKNFCFPFYSGCVRALYLILCVCSWKIPQ